MSNWTISQKVSAQLLALLALALCVGVFGLWIAARTGRELNAVRSQYLPLTETASRFEEDILNARIHFIYFATVQKRAHWKRAGIASARRSRNIRSCISWCSNRRSLLARGPASNSSDATSTPTAR